MDNIHLSDCIWQNYFTNVEDLASGKDSVERKIVMPMIVLVEEHIFKYVFKRIFKLVFHKRLLRVSCGCTASILF